MKVIDLLDRLANDEEVPEYIRYYNIKYNKEDIMLVCKENIIYKLDQLEISLKDEVEAIKEKYRVSTQMASRDIEKYTDAIDVINKNIRELTKATNYLLKKVDD